MGDDKEIERITRMATRATTKRASVISQIRSIHSMALSVRDDASLKPTFSVLVADLDSLWSQFKSEDESELDCLLLLGRVDDYSHDLPTEVRKLVGESKAVATSLIPTGAEAIDLSYITKIPSTSANSVEPPAQSFSRLPEIPLPVFDGDVRYWPTFRDRFLSLVDSRSNVSNIDKMYYLIGCLKGAAADAVRGIPVSADNYNNLVWSTLSTRFFRPRLVATSLLDKLLQVSYMSQESHKDLNDFMCLFAENMSLLNALHIPDLGSFILFSIAFRSLPVTTRKLFESTSTSEYPSITELLNFVQSRVAVLEIVGEPRKKVVTTMPSKFGPPASHVRKGGERLGEAEGFRPTPASLVTSKSNNLCPCCSGSHEVATCARFKSWEVDERIRWTREKRLCYQCFRDDHLAPKCTIKTRCRNCSRRHHVLLHPSVEVTQVDADASPPDTSLCAATMQPSQQKSTAVMLGTALVHVRDRSGTWQTMRALVDCASQISAVTADCVRRLGLRCTRWTTPISGLAGVPVLDVQGRVELNIQPRFATEPVLEVQAWVLPTITSNLPRDALPSKLGERYSNLALADPSFNVTSPIDLLLGGDIYALIMNGKKVTIDSKLPAAFGSVFGWILIGPVFNQDVRSYQSLPVSLTVSIESLVDRFWHVEEPDTAPVAFSEDGRCEQIFRDQCVRLPSGKFSVPLLFRTPVSATTFDGSRDVAIRRFESLERKLSNDSQLKNLYINFMSEYISLGHMSVATSPGRYFIPHHAVYRPQVDDSKIRVVFDASAHGALAPSLNQVLMSGPKLQRDIVDILTRFRIHKYAFTTDICKMYRQVMILPDYRQYQHILWRASPYDELIEYELHTVTYGVNCAPFLALRVLQSIASDECDHNEPVHNALIYQTYVDDICDGADSIPDALSLQNNLISILSRSGFELKKWASNTPAILDAVPTSDRVDKPTPFDDVDSVGTKVLGLEWHPDGDFFCCALNLELSPIFSKRGILSLVARIFDPLGLFGPSVFLAKTVMQRTWQRELSWDEPLPGDIHDEWAAFVSDLPALRRIQVPRHINSVRGSSCYLLGFCDASLHGYAAVVYIRMVDPSVDNPSQTVFLIGTKTKLAPLKPLTVPRLELNAALLLARWMARVRSILEPQLNIIGVRAWSDSMIVLSWLNVPHESIKIYVSNRVHQIRSLLPGCEWQYIESQLNPADCASRGLMPSALARFNLYWQGPLIAYADPSEWLNLTPSLPLNELPETRPVSCAVHIDETPAEWFERFSSYDRLLRVVARLLRFVARVRRRNPCTTSFLLKSELDRAVQVLAIESQRIHFSVLHRELSSGRRVSSKPLARLSPFIDSNGVIRVGCRLRHSLLVHDCKHPILLAKRSIFALLLCRRWHLFTGHAGPRVLAALISRQFWVVSLRSVLHHVLATCVVCVRLDAKPPSPFMADLPATRVRPQRPFACVGVDYAGPIQMRELRLRKSRVYKVYVAVFVCFAVKAVHLEVVSELSTDAFLAAFDRFVARRGLPSDIYSDCGTNFVGADKQLQALIHGPEAQAAMAGSRTGCEWHLNPPSAPHFGGLWEAAVRSMKRLLIRVMGTHTFTYEEFTTILCRVEAVLNSRPLTPASTDPHDLDCLSPGHFLIGQPLLAVPPRSGPDTCRTLTNRWKLLDQCHQSFWRRWAAEYLTTLQERSKWTTSSSALKVDDMVVIVDNQSPPLSWRLGRVSELLPGSDGHVRVVRVITSSGLITRPVVKLVKLPSA